MSQSSLNIANADGATVRAAINAALQATASKQSGATAPSTTYAGQFWWDTGNNLLKIRDAANTAWVTVASWDGSTWKPYYAGTDILARANTWTADPVFAAGNPSSRAPDSASNAVWWLEDETGARLGALYWNQSDGSVRLTRFSSPGVVDSEVTIRSDGIDADGYFQGGKQIEGATAWVNFNGSGVVAIRDSFNVTSITDNGTGDYTANLTSAVNANAPVLATAAQASASSLNAPYASAVLGSTTTVAIGSWSSQAVGTRVDFPYIQIAVMGV